jgi:hypothetical protein
MSLWGCGTDPKAPTDVNFAHAIDHALDRPEEGLCLSHTPAFPADVKDNSSSEVAEYARFVRAGLATEKIEDRVWRFGNSVHPEKVHVYALTSAGTRGIAHRIGFFTGGPTFCFASLRVGKIVNFAEPANALGVRITQVRWTPRVERVADWATSPGAKAAFPEIERDLSSPHERGSALQLADSGWEVVDVLR